MQLMKKDQWFLNFKMRSKLEFKTKGFIGVPDAQSNTPSFFI